MASPLQPLARFLKFFLCSSSPPFPYWAGQDSTWCDWAEEKVASHDKDYRQMTDPPSRQRGRPQEDKDSHSLYEKLKSGHESQKGLDTKTDWLTDRQP
jgi:hypothetical protein